MPNRFIRESCRTSKTLAQLSHGAERFFWRLTTVADDFGRFEADPRVLLANCFPLKIGTLKPITILGWLNELVRVGLVILYTVKDKTLGFFINWQKYQTSRSFSSKFPEPPVDLKAPSPHDIPNEKDVEDLLFDHLSQQNEMVGLSILSLERQVRVQESYLDMVIKTENFTIIVELKRSRITNKAVGQLQKYCDLIANSKGILIGCGIGPKVDIRDLTLNHAIVTYDQSFNWTLLASGGFLKDCNWCPNVKSRDSTLCANPKRVSEESIRRKYSYSEQTGFAQLWTSYPQNKKSSRRKAEQAWQAINPNEQLQQAILRAVERATTSVEWTKDGGRWIPHLHNWLDDRGWEGTFTPLPTKPVYEVEHDPVTNTAIRRKVGEKVKGVT